MENAKLLEKHAQLQGVDPAEMLFGGDGEERLATNLEEEIMTAEDYLDDAEEETAQRIDKKKDRIPPKERTPEYSEDMNESAIEQILEDEEGNLYIEDADGNLIPYELPSHLQNLRVEGAGASGGAVRRNS